MMYKGDEISLAEVVRRFGADSAEYEVTKCVFGSVGILLLCLESPREDSINRIVNNIDIGFLETFPVPEIDDRVKELSKSQSGHWRLNGKNIV